MRASTHGFGVGAAAFGLIIASAPTSASAPSHDAWRYERSISLTTHGQGELASLDLPPEVMARARPDLGDVRILDDRGNEVPFVVDRLESRRAEMRWSGRLVEAERTYGRASAWTIDLEEPRTFDRIELTIANGGFATRVRVATSLDGDEWSEDRNLAPIFDRMWEGARVRHTHIDMQSPTRARWIRLTTWDRRRVALDLQGVDVTTIRDMAGRRWRRELTLVPQPSSDSTSRYAIEPSPSLPIERLVVATRTPLFFRRAQVRELRKRGTREEERSLASADIYRITLPEADVSGESLEIDLGRAAREPLILVIENGDSPPLLSPSVTAEGDTRRLVFLPVSDASALRLIYGNALAHPPVYDIASLKDRLALAPSQASASIGPEIERGDVPRTQPMSHSPHLGAPLSSAPWRLERALPAIERADVCAVALQPEDLAELRPDLGDLRLVDDRGSQVPFILDREAVRSWIDLATASSRTLTSDGRRGTSRLALQWDDARSLPLQAVDIRFAEDFFARPARLYTISSGDSARQRERLAFRGTLRHEPGEEEDIVIPLRGTVVRSLALEIDNGDNLPLRVTHARAAIDLPQVVFYAGPGSYRLLLGNPHATAPVYDIEVLRSQILDKDLVILEAGPLAPNRDKGWLAGWRGDGWSPGRLGSGLLLAVLVGACLVLVALILRIIREPPAPPPAG